MLYEVSSPLFTLGALMVLGGIVYSCKTFVDRKMAALTGNDSKTNQLERAEA